jgi:SAM-dependent methyltransferase
MLADRSFDRFDRLRSRLVSRLASDDVLEAYNDLTYSAQKVYDSGSDTFRSELFNWEADLAGRVLRPPPGRILVGGAGGGREAFALAERGYTVTAFEPSPALARSMADHAAARSASVDAWIGRYEALPRLESIDGREAKDLGTGATFDAALLGWTSFSHVRSREARILTLRAFAQVTDGPVAFSFYLGRARRHPASGAARLLDAIGLGGAGDRFTPHVGYFHVSQREELEAEIAEAGLRVIDASWDDSDGRWPWVAVVRLA